MCINVYGQNNPADEAAVKQTINNLFNGMRTSDTTLMSSALSPRAIMQTVTKNAAGVVNIGNTPTPKFIESIAGEHPVYDEQISFNSIKIDGDLASVWTNYKFYVGGSFSHCGVNSFQLARLKDGWKIIYIIDTRRKDNCNAVD